MRFVLARSSLGAIALSAMLASCSTLLGIQDIEPPGDGGAGAGGGGGGGAGGGAGGGGGAGAGGGGGGVAAGGGQGGGGGTAGGGGAGGGGGTAAGGGGGAAGGGGPLDGGISVDASLDGPFNVFCPNPSCPVNEACCYDLNAGAILCEPGCSNNDTVACLSPSECGGDPSTNVCCATFTTSATQPCPVESFTSVCTSSCTTTVSISCGGTGTFHLCSTSADCVKDTANPACCSIGSGVFVCLPPGGGTTCN